MRPSGGELCTLSSVSFRQTAACGSDRQQAGKLYGFAP